MDARTRSALVRWLLLACVAFGIVVMHHVMADHQSDPIMHTAAPMAGAPMDQQPAPDPAPPNDVLHQCMAVVVQNGIAVIVLLLLTGVVVLLTPKRAAERAPARAPQRPPPALAGRALLHSVCIARL
jgi:hypothetical protein